MHGLQVKLVRDRVAVSGEGSFDIAVVDQESLSSEGDG